MFCSPESRFFSTRRAWILLTAGLAARRLYGEELPRIDPPSDDALDPALIHLLERLRGIVAARKHLALEALMAGTFRPDFDVAKGPAGFQRHWQPQSASSPIWGILERLLALPGYGYSESLYAFPYVCARFPLQLDLLGHVVAIREGVNLLAEPKADAARMGSLSYSIVPLAQPMAPGVVIPAGGFVELKHPQLGRCFVASADVYSPAAHRAFFEKRQGQWRWISLAAPTLKDPPELKLHTVTG